MRRFLGSTWLPALLFALPVFLVEFLSPGVRRPPAGTWTLYMLTVTPPVWWLTASRQGQVTVGRWARHGALCGAVLVMIPAFLAMGCIMLSSGREQSGGLATALLFVVLFVAACILVPLGAAIGALMASLRQRTHVERPIR